MPQRSPRYLLAAWSWAIDTGNLDTAFSILAGFAPSDVWTTYPLKLPGETAVGLPGAAQHPGYPLALAVSALFASIGADEADAEELCRRAAEASARRDTQDWRGALELSGRELEVARLVADGLIRRSGLGSARSAGPGPS